MKVTWVDIHKKLASAPIEEGQKLDISAANYISSESKAKFEQFKVDKVHNFGHLLRVLWKLDHLSLF